MSQAWVKGNATDDTADNRGWLVGHFIDQAHGPRSTGDVEVKWAHHPNGEERAEWTADDQRTTLVVLIYGRFRVDLTDGSSTMERQGDYVMWGAGVDHSWEALADSLVMTVRWPSAT